MKFMHVTYHLMLCSQCDSVLCGQHDHDKIITKHYLRSKDVNAYIDSCKNWRMEEKKISMNTKTEQT